MGEAWLHNFWLCPHSHISFSYQGSVTPDIADDEGTYPFSAPFSAYMFGDAVPRTLLLLMFGLRRDFYRKRAARNNRMIDILEVGGCSFWGLETCRIDEGVPSFREAGSMGRILALRLAIVQG